MSTPEANSWSALDGAALESLAASHGTPFFLYDADRVNARIEAIRRAFDGRVDVLYAVKANPNLGLLTAVRSTADGLDVSSAGEIDQALTAGYEPCTLSFAGPAKTRDELSHAIRHAIGCISVESVRELHDCIEIAQRTGASANVALRVNPQSLNRSFGLKMGGRAIQFGIDEEHVLDAARIVAANARQLDFRGIHVYSGSQCFEPEGVRQAVEDALRIVRNLEENSPLVCRTINLGGGFGVSHHDDDRQMDLRALAEVLRPVLQDFIERSPSARRLVFELGRYLTASAGLYVARVVGTKSSRGKEFVMVDGGLNHHLAAAGTFGAALRSNFILRNLSRPQAAPMRCTVAGPSCNPTDLLGVEVELPRPEIGDLLGVLNAGSYGLTASPVLFLGRPTPAEFVRYDGIVTLARRPRPMTDFN